MFARQIFTAALGYRSLYCTLCYCVCMWEFPCSSAECLLMYCQLHYAASSTCRQQLNKLVVVKRYSCMESVGEGMSTCILVIIILYFAEAQSYRVEVSDYDVVRVSYHIDVLDWSESIFQYHINV